MRLSPKEVKAITSAFAECLVEIQFKIYLFGSRTDVNKKGGDIDLLVLVDAIDKTKVVELKSKVRQAIFKIIPEQKIDITVATEVELSTDVFLMSIAESLVLLRR